ncbi:MAG: insulinase family protein [Chitinophagaceae bacterium]
MKRYKHFWIWLLLIFISTASQAQDKALPFNKNILKGQLPNGLKYFILQNKKPEKKIELRLAINAGSILEDNDQLGLAHLMEHMNFNGLKNFPKNEVVHYLQSIGVDFGADLNAYTSFDETVYILPIPADDKTKIERGFQIIADWSGAALLENDEIDKERNVVLEESRLGKGADDRMMKIWLPEYLNGSLYADRLPIGDDELLKNFKHDVIKRFHRDWYRPNLQAVIVVGDIDPKEAERLIIEKFSGFKNPNNERARPDIIDIPFRAESKAMVLNDKESPYTMVQIIGNSKQHRAATTESGYIEDIMAKAILNSMFGARFDEIRQGANPPFVFAASQLGEGWARHWENFQQFAICGNDKIKEATTALITEAMKVKRYGFTQSELDRAKADFLANYEKQYNERDKTDSKALVNELVRHFLTNECVPGIAWEYEFVKNNIDKITLRGISKYYNDINIDQGYFALVTTKPSDKLPTNEDLRTYVEQALRADVQAYTEKALPTSLLEKEPQPGKVTTETKNAKLGTTTWTLSNGATVTYKKTDFKNDEIMFSAYRMGGSSLYEGKDFMSADFSNNVVDEMGYGQFTNSDLQKFLSGKTLSVSPVIVTNMEMINGRSTNKDFVTAMQLLYLKCTSPRMDEELFAAFKNKNIQIMAEQKSDPQTHFFDSLSQYQYKNHPRSKDIYSAEDFESIQMNNAVAFYKQRFETAYGMHYYFVGSIDESQFKATIEKYIGGLSGQKVVTTFKDIKMDDRTGDNNFTFKKGSEPKSMVIEKMYSNTKYNAEDELPMKLLTEVINNRITDIIREKMSAIYGGGVGLRLTKFPKEKFSLQSYLPCGPENAEKVKAAFWDIISEVKKANNITQEELTKARETAIQKNNVSIKTNGYWMSALSKADQYGLNPNEILELESKLKSIKPSDLTAIAVKYLSKGDKIHALLMPEN